MPSLRAVLVLLPLASGLGAQHWERLYPLPGSLIANDVLFDGDTWTYTGTRWSRTATATTPPYGWQTLVDDLLAQRRLLVGNDLVAGYTVWAFANGNWAPLPTNSAPPARLGEAMAYDWLRGHVVVFGGYSSTTGELADTWVFDGTHWSSVAGPAPQPRKNHAMVHDVPRDRIVLFGGSYTPPLSNAVALDDTWEFDGQQWTQVVTPQAPPPREWAKLSYDFAHVCVVLHGGFQFPTSFQDTWEYRGTTWQQVVTPHSPPAGLAGELAFDPGTARVRLASTDERWLYDGVDWTRQSLALRPGLRVGTALAYDQARRRLLLFGGQDDLGTDLADTLEYDGTTWSAVPTTTAPSPRNLHALAYDAGRRQTLLFGGQGAAGMLADTWTFDGVAWRQLTPAHQPSARSGHALACDDARGRIVLFGGGTAADTWEFDGVDWQLVATTAAPAARIGHALAYDAAHGVVVLFGGSTVQLPAVADTWTFDGAQWTQVGGTAPPPHTGHALAYDPVRGRTVLCGLSGPQTNDTWEFDGTTWTPSPAVAAAGGASLRAAYDVARNQVLVLDSKDFGAFRFDTGLSAYVVPVAATWTPYGKGCPGPQGMPTLAAAPQSLPQLGSTFALQLQGLPPAPGLVALGFGVQFASNPQLQLPIRLDTFGLPGCNLWLAPLSNLLLSHQGLATNFSLPIPASPALDGLVLATQAVVLDPSAPSLVGGLTNGGLLRLH